MHTLRTVGRFGRMDRLRKHAFRMCGQGRNSMTTTNLQSTTEQTLEPCPNPACGSSKATASNDWTNYYVYCPECFLRGPRESTSSLGENWNALPRLSPASAAPVVDTGMCNICGSSDTGHDCTAVLLSRARWLIVHYAHSFSETDKQEALPLTEQIALLLAKKAEAAT